MDKFREIFANINLDFIGRIGALSDIRVYLNFSLIFGVLIAILVIFLTFYFKRALITSLFSLYFSILLAVFLPLETQIARVTSFSYAPLIGFSFIFGVMIYMLTSIFSKRKVIRQDFSRISLLIISLGFIGLFISTFSIFAPEATTASLLKDYSFAFEGSKMQSIWFFTSLGTLVIGSLLNRRD